MMLRDRTFTDKEYDKMPKGKAGQASVSTLSVSTVRSSISMTVDQWLAVADNPRQRDTERHALKARHLDSLSPTHAFVSAAKLPDGSLVKLDGHTRALKWRRGELARPPRLEVAIIEVRNVEEAKELYTHFDNKAALETAPDQVSGAFREMGFKPKSPLLAHGNISQALRICWVGFHGYSDRGRTVYDQINEFAVEILELDDLCVKKRQASSGIVAAFLLTHRKHGPDVVQFWRKFFNNEGYKADGEMDCVQGLIESSLIQNRSKPNTVCGCALRAVELWLAEVMVRKPILRPMEIAGYLSKKIDRNEIARKYRKP